MTQITTWIYDSIQCTLEDENSGITKGTGGIYPATVSLPLGLSSQVGGVNRWRVLYAGIDSQSSSLSTKIGNYQQNKESTGFNILL